MYIKLLRRTEYDAIKMFMFALLRKRTHERNGLGFHFGNVSSLLNILLPHLFIHVDVIKILFPLKILYTSTFQGTFEKKDF